MTGPWRRAARYAEVVDPGAIRRRAGARAALAALSAWVIMRALTLQIHGDALAAPALFAVMTCFGAALAIGDPQRTERRVTLLVAAVVAAVALAAAALLVDHGAARDVLLLVLMFASFASRRFGLRTGEVVLVATITAYSASSAGVRPSDLDWFLTATLAGFGSLVLWQEILLRYDPRKGLRAALRSYDERAAELVDSVRGALAVSGGDRPADLGRQLERVQTTRRVIESQLPGAARHSRRQDARLAELQVAVYSTEQGLATMVDAIADRTWIAALDDTVRASLERALGELERVLLHTAGADAGDGQLVSSAARMRDDATAVIAQTGRDAAAWVRPVVQLARGAQRLTQSVVRSRQLIDRTTTSASSDASAAAGTSTASPLQRLHGMHPTKVLGLQAVVAALVAAGLAYLGGLEHVNWTYWTAFVVIAGSAGESSRRMLLRVAGTTAGAASGATLALLLPDRVIAVAAIAVIGAFMSIYEAPVSYTRMVFWLNVGFVVAFAQTDVGEVELLRQRVLAAAIGGIVAAVVARTVLPIHVVDRLRRIIAGYLGSVARATRAWVEACVEISRQPHAEAESARSDGLLREIRTATATATFERNPFPGTEMPWTTRVVQVAAIGDALATVARSAPDDEPLTDARLATVRRLGDQIVGDIGALQGRLDPARSPATAGSAEAHPDASAGDGGAGRSAAPDCDWHDTQYDSLDDEVVRAFAGLRRTVRDLANSIDDAGASNLPARFDRRTATS